MHDYAFRPDLDVPGPRSGFVADEHRLEPAADADLLARAGRRDHAAFEAIYLRHHGAVVRVAARVCRNAAVADEIAQQTFMALWERAGRLAAKSIRLRPWLTTVARNAAIDHLRARDEATLPLETVYDRAQAGPGPEESVLAAEGARELHAALTALPPAQRGVVELVYFGGMSHRAAAVATGRPIGTVKSRLRLAVDHLRREIVR